MGDRANIVIPTPWAKDGSDQEAVFLYGHWSGHDLPETLRRVLAMEKRWDDPAYLGRIVLEAMVGDQRGSETGFGISTRLGDGEYDLLVLSDQTIYQVPMDAYRERGLADLDSYPHISFAQYIAADERTWENLPEEANV